MEVVKNFYKVEKGHFPPRFQQVFNQQGRWAQEQGKQDMSFLTLFKLGGSDCKFLTIFGKLDPSLPLQMFLRCYILW